MSSRRASDFARVMLPSPPAAYTIGYMRALVDRTEQLIASRVGKDEWLTLGSAGLPIVKCHGTNAALAITAGAGITQLTFDTADLDTDPDTTLQAGSFNLKSSYAAVYMIHAYIKHNAAPSIGFGTDNKTALIYLYVNGTESQRLAQLMVTGARLGVTFFVTLAANDVADIRLNSSLISFQVDMTGSYLWAIRLTQDARSRVL